MWSFVERKQLKKQFRGFFSFFFIFIFPVNVYDECSLALGEEPVVVVVWAVQFCRKGTWTRLESAACVLSLGAFSCTNQAASSKNFLRVVNIRSLVMFCVVALCWLLFRTVYERNITKRYITETQYHTCRVLAAKLHTCDMCSSDEMETTTNQLPFTSRYPQCNLAAVGFVFLAWCVVY